MIRRESRRSLARGVARTLLAGALAASALAAPLQVLADLQPLVPADRRGQTTAERYGVHDASNIRTRFYNFGMVGDYPPDPLRVDLSVFHSVEVPKGTGLNYSDGITPFVLTRFTDLNDELHYIMETGFRERQGLSPYYNRMMRFEHLDAHYTGFGALCD